MAGAHRFRLPRKGVALAVLAASAAPFGPVAWAQDAGGPLVTLDLGTELSAETNKALDPVSAGTTFTSANTLGLGFVSQTRTETLRFNFGSGYELSRLPGGTFDTGFTDPMLQFSYAREGADSRLELNADYARHALSQLQWQTDSAGNPIAPTVLDTGTQLNYGFGGTFEIGIDAPLGATFDASRRVTTYAGTTDPGYYDSITTSAGATLRARISPVTEANLTYRFSLYDADDASLTLQRTQEISAGLTQQISPTATLSASAGYTFIHRSFGTPGFVDQNFNGFTAHAAYDLELPRGSFAARLDHNVETTGSQTTAMLERGFEFATGSLTVAAGGTASSGFVYPVGRVDYQMAGKTTNLSLSLARQVSTTSAGDDLLSTTAHLGLDYEVNELSRLGLALDFADVTDAAGGTALDRRQATISARYTHDITDTVSIYAGAGYDYYTAAGTSPANNTRLFVGLTSQTRYRP